MWELRQSYAGTAEQLADYLVDNRVLRPDDSIICIGPGIPFSRFNLRVFYIPPELGKSENPIGRISVHPAGGKAYWTCKTLSEDCIRYVRGVANELTTLGLGSKAIEQTLGETADLAHKSKRGKSRYSKAEKIAAVKEWDAIDPELNPILLPDWLEEKFGSTAGILNVAESTLHGWRQKYHEEIESS